MTTWTDYDGQPQDGDGAQTASRGFAAMDPERQREIARLGGRTAHQRKRAHRFTTEEARNAGRKGGQTVSQDREHMATIGRRGGSRVSQDREHMAEIGREGGQARGRTDITDLIDATDGSNAD
jgi:general stress protein YciG